MADLKDPIHYTATVSFGVSPTRLLATIRYHPGRSRRGTQHIIWSPAGAPCPQFMPAKRAVQEHYPEYFHWGVIGARRANFQVLRSADAYEDATLLPAIRTVLFGEPYEGEMKDSTLSSSLE